mgnify:CR=1 FL=1
MNSGFSPISSPRPSELERFPWLNRREAFYVRDYPSHGQAGSCGLIYVFSTVELKISVVEMAELAFDYDLVTEPVDHLEKKPLASLWNQQHKSDRVSHESWCQQ